jgi:hypothetical protein
LGKFKFLRTLFEYDNFVPLSLPLLPQTIPTLDPDLLLDQHMYHNNPSHGRYTIPPLLFIAPSSTYNQTWA